MPRILLISDSPHTKGLVSKLKQTYPELIIVQSGLGELDNIESISVKDEWKMLSTDFDLIISIHCKEIFPSDLVSEVRCINVHPGFNPFNRGWFPHVFSLINGEPAGVTIHEMDSKIDNGPIIVQKVCKAYSWDTSLSIYNRIIELEEELVLDWFSRIIAKDYTTFSAEQPGSFNSSKDYESLRNLSLGEKTTLGDIVNRLRALSHGEYRNAYFFDPEGKKIFVRLDLIEE
jgi:methionyl-tRNA formyltransferase